MCFGCIKSKKIMDPIYIPLYVHQCNQCKGTFNSNKQYEKHMKKYHKNNFN
jgi:hypothetical protein